MSPQAPSPLLKDAAGPQAAVKQPAAPAPPRQTPLRVVTPEEASAAKAAAPPSLRPRQRVLERRLRAKAHMCYLGLAWHQRTHLFSEAWDQARKRHACVLNTYFCTPGPRWRHPQWWHLDQGRRLADLFGARYEQWIAAQFARVEALSGQAANPGDLHGRVALEAYLFGGGGQQASGQQPASSGQALFQGRFPSQRPFVHADFDRLDPQHNLYVVGILAEMIDLTQMLGDGRGLNTDSISVDDLWLVLASFDAATMAPRPQPVAAPQAWIEPSINL